VASEKDDVPVAAMAKRKGGALYVFGVGMRDRKTTATFTLEGRADGDIVEVLDENRTMAAKEGVFRDEFQPLDVHLYRVRAPAGTPGNQGGRQ
jgi:hypothetical protein